MKELYLRIRTLLLEGHRRLALEILRELGFPDAYEQLQAVQRTIDEERQR